MSIGVAVATVVVAAGAAGAARDAAGASCRVHRGLQDSRCTPGAALAGVTAADVCRPGYAAAVRRVTAAVRTEVFREYGIVGSHARGTYEVDHLISLELGGSNDIRNLWPEAALPAPGFHDKDRLENELHRQVCARTITLRRAQQLIRRDWLAAYRRLVRAG